MASLLDRHAKQAAATLKSSRQLMAQGKTAEAETVCRLFLQLTPDNIAVMLELGLLLLEHAPQESETFIAKILAADARNANALTAMARLRLEVGARDEALAFAARAKEASPTAPLLHRLGVIYREAGLRAEAAECFAAALKRDPDFVTAWHGLAELKKIKRGDAEFTAIESAAKKSANLPGRQRIPLEFALGRVYCENGEAEKGFAHYAAAHSLRREGARYSADMFDQYIDLIIETFAIAPVGSSRSEQPVFIVGLPRSGSTLVDQILCSHPDVKGLGEAPNLQNALPFVANADLPAAAAPGIPTISRAFMERLDAVTLDRVAEKYLAQIPDEKRDAKRVTDKMLSNFLWLGAIRRVFPQARIIHCRRDPLDCALSIWQTLFSAGVMPWADDLTDIGRHMRSYQRLMAHWGAAFPGQFHELSYEAMIKDQEGETRRLLDYCGLSWESRCLSFHDSARVVKTASAAQVRQPIYGDSVGKSQKYAKFLLPITRALSENS